MLLLRVVGYLDHMIDQLNSHAQIGVSAVVSLASENPRQCSSEDQRNRFAGADQQSLVRAVGRALGGELRKLLPSSASVQSKSSRFCCPLDEALVEAVLEFGSDVAAGLQNFELAPFGKFPKGGRKAIGSLNTCTVQSFFEELAVAMGVAMSLKKLRGDNAHHIVESSFKAFSRALRVLIDTGKGYSILSQSGGVESKRSAVVKRETKETTIEVEVLLDEKTGSSSISTGIAFLDEMYQKMEESSGVCMNVKCKGDLWIDDHHSAEDVSIALGKAINQALGSKGGLNRMWTSTGVCGDCEVEVVMDVSNRPMIVSDVDLSAEEEKVDDLSVEMIEHVFESLVVNSQMTVHFLTVKTGSVRELSLAAAEAWGTALKHCIAIDQRRAGKVSSSKGTLSV